MYSYSFDSQKDLLKIDMILLPDNILSLTDKMTMSSSVEAGVPFLDHRLIELLSLKMMTNFMEIKFKF